MWTMSTVKMIAKFYFKTYRNVTWYKNSLVSLKHLISNLEARLLIKCPQHIYNFSESQVCHKFFEFAGSWPKSRENKSTKASLRDHHVWQPLLKGQLNRGLVSKGHTNQLELTRPQLSEEATPSLWRASKSSFFCLFSESLQWHRLKHFSSDGF